MFNITGNKTIDNESQYEITDKEIEEYLKRKEAREYVKNKAIDYDFRFIKLEELKSFIDANPAYVSCDLNFQNKCKWDLYGEYGMLGNKVKEFFDKYVLVMNLEKDNHEKGK